MTLLTGKHPALKQLPPFSEEGLTRSGWWVYSHEYWPRKVLCGHVQNGGQCSAEWTNKEPRSGEVFAFLGCSSADNALSAPHSTLYLAGSPNQSYLYVIKPKSEKDMLNQRDMTYTAKILYCCLSNNNWKSVEYLAGLMQISIGRCQLILTQLVMAGLAVEEESGENFKRRQ